MVGVPLCHAGIDVPMLEKPGHLYCCVAVAHLRQVGWTDAVRKVEERWAYFVGTPLKEQRRALLRGCF